MKLKKGLLEKCAVYMMFANGMIEDDIIVVLQLGIIIFLMGTVKVSKKISAFIIFLFVGGLFGCIVGTDMLPLMIMQIIGISVSAVFYLNVIHSGNLESVFYLIKKCTLIVSIIGIVQQIAFLFNIKFLYDLSWLVHRQGNFSTDFYRSYSLYCEPAQFATVIMPMSYVALYRLMGMHRKVLEHKISIIESIIILSAFIFTFSSMGYVGLMAAFGLICLEYKMGIGQLFILMMAVIALVIFYQHVPMFAERLNDTFYIIFSNTDINEHNLSTQTLIINAKVALTNLKKTYGFGGGIGSHPIAYLKYAQTDAYAYMLNARDANSLMLRIISETGIAGLLILCGFIRKYSNTGKTFQGIINRACLTVLIIRLLRSGHYFNDGLWLILILYQCCGRKGRLETGCFYRYRHQRKNAKAQLG